jgi:hypothetical protein
MEARASTHKTNTQPLSDTPSVLLRASFQVSETCFLFPYLNCYLVVFLAE